jgi:hypothetical protein
VEAFTAGLRSAERARRHTPTAQPLLHEPDDADPAQVVTHRALGTGGGGDDGEGATTQSAAGHDGTSQSHSEHVARIGSPVSSA